ncbi:hypothetical protein FACS1894182_13420 [Bacteroidia bacterium]|nr:hypothetical protein FACS1894182_13420 [Bacteroidia bacterium]
MYHFTYTGKWIYLAISVNILKFPCNIVVIRTYSYLRILKFYSYNFISFSIFIKKKNCYIFKFKNTNNIRG